MSVAMTGSTEAVDITAESPHIGNTNGSDYRVIFGRISLSQRCQLVRFTRKPYKFLRFTQAYEAILTDIYDFCRFKLTIIPRFIFELLSVCNDTRYAS